MIWEVPKSRGLGGSRQGLWRHCGEQEIERLRIAGWGISFRYQVGWVERPVLRSPSAKDESDTQKNREFILRKENGHGSDTRPQPPRRNRRRLKQRAHGHRSLSREIRPSWKIPGRERRLLPPGRFARTSRRGSSDSGPGRGPGEPRRPRRQRRRQVVRAGSSRRRRLPPAGRRSPASTSRTLSSPSSATSSGKRSAPGSGGAAGPPFGPKDRRGGRS